MPADPFAEHARPPTSRRRSPRAYAASASRVGWRRLGIDRSCTKALRSTGTAMVKQCEDASIRAGVEAPGIDRSCTKALRSTGTAMAKQCEDASIRAGVEAPGI